jgi:hypothetical protein
MHGARALQRARLRRAVGDVEALAALAPRELAFEAERVVQQRVADIVAVRAHAVEAQQRVLARHAGTRRRQRLVGHVNDEQLVLEPFGIGEQQARLGSRRLRQAALPEVERLRRADAPEDPVDHAVARAPAREARVLEERQVAAGTRVGVGVEEVVDGRVVLVDGLLDQSQPEHAHVELDVGGGVSRDRRDVVDPFEAHAQ